MSGPATAADRLAVLEHLAGTFDLDAAVRAGERRRRRRAAAVAAVVATALVGAALARHATPADPPRPPAVASARDDLAAAGARSDQDAVEEALAAVAPGLPALDWASAATSAESSPSGTSPAAGPSQPVDVARFAPFTGVRVVDLSGSPAEGVGFRVTRARGAGAPVDPCSAGGAHAVPGGPDGQLRPTCTVHTGAGGGPGGSAGIPGAGGDVALREWQEVLDDGPGGGVGSGPVVQTVRQAVLVTGRTTWSLAVDAVGTSGVGGTPALDAGQLELGVRYLATAAAEDGPGVDTARLVSQAVLARELTATAHGAPGVDWTAPGTDSAGSAPPGPDGRRLVDVLETTALGDRARFAYRVVRAAGPAPQDLCVAAGAVPVEPGTACRVTGQVTGQVGGGDGVRVATLERAGVREVTVTTSGSRGVGRWASAAVTARVPGSTAALPLDAGQLERLARALAAADAG